MARTGKDAIARAMTTSSPKLVIVNSSVTNGRVRQMLRLRPTTIARIRRLTVGPIYLVIEHALEKLADELEALPTGTMYTLNGRDMDPTKEDVEMIEKDAVPTRRGKGRSPSDKALDES